jgi:hypothetical protein
MKFADAIVEAIECEGDPEPGRAFATSLRWEAAVRRHVESYREHPKS